MERADHVGVKHGNMVPSDQIMATWLPWSKKRKEDTTMKCKECDMENIDGALFCEECGAKLDTMEPLQDTEVETGNVRQLVLTSTDGNKLDLPAKDEVVIGREDPV